MSTTTLPLPAGVPARASARTWRGWFARVWWAIIEAQQKRADRHVSEFVSRLSPEQLKAYGFSPADARRARRDRSAI